MSFYHSAKSIIQYGLVIFDIFKHFRNFDVLLFDCSNNRAHRFGGVPAVGSLNSEFIAPKRTGRPDGRPAWVRFIGSHWGNRYNLASIPRRRILRGLFP